VVNIRNLEINAELDGDYEFHYVRIHFQIQTDDEGIRTLMNVGHQSTTVSYGLRSLPANIRKSIETYVNVARARLKTPTREVMGRQVYADFDLKHAGYQINSGAVKISGYVRWPTGTMENIDETFPSTVFTEGSQQLFKQLGPWALNHAKDYVEGELQKAFQSIAAPKVFPRTSVLLSYKKGGIRRIRRTTLSSA